MSRYRIIGLKLVTPSKSPKRKDKFVNRTFWPMVLVLSIKNVFVKMKNYNFLLEFTRYGIIEEVFNCKKRYQKWKILFCTKSMWDTKKNLGKKIVRFKKIYKLANDYFSIRVIYFHLFIKNVFMTIKNSISPQNIRDTQKMLRNKWSFLVRWAQYFAVG